MAYFCRSLIGANSLVKTSVCRFPVYQIRPVTMRVIQVQPPVTESHDQKNMRLKRPMSPHLLIYKPQLTSMLSITHRITGVALSVYALGFAAFSLSPGSFPHMVEAIQAMHIAAPVVFTSKLILSLPVSYHLCNGIRHLVWDFGKALTIKDVYTTGYILCAATAVLTVVFASM
ncbi:succinate dehydrogenase cytochrome b560 subunit, mitochondrial-like [Macrosteles quadrilineatus]|uniref:succinate dehydrogenase cytochrome b560 subunit, mitochondrial-like n=1 Tax=Macrosteles quadrilineatus TaxID=74068 RepID=UPI0023E113AA|nr:succinate dehydrogenase cytochrome b560 subunit, mitochondrial-like [Macrosteles quadrilineatus]